MLTIFKIVLLLLDVAFFILLVHVIMSWLLEPVYRPIRRMLPNTGGLDLAPLVVFLIIIILRDIVVPDLARALI